MGDYNSNNRGGQSRFGRRDSGRRSFGGGRDYGRPSMHKATCAECGNDCEVPFLPSGDRPVYCSNCFEKRGKRDSNSRGSGGGNFQRPNYEDRKQYSSQGFDYGRPRGNDNGPLFDQLKSLNIKLDKIINLLEPKIEKAPVSIMKVEDLNMETKIEKPKIKKAKSKKVKSESEIIL